jgi:hypothetical protein
MSTSFTVAIAAFGLATACGGMRGSGGAGGIGITSETGTGVTAPESSGTKTTPTTTAAGPCEIDYMCLPGGGLPGQPGVTCTCVFSGETCDSSNACNAKCKVC